MGTMSSWLDSVQAGKYSDSTSLPPEETQNTQNTQDQNKLIGFIRFIPGVEAKNTDFNAVGNFVDLVRATSACDHQRVIDADIILAELDADDIACLPTLDRHDKQVWSGLLAHRLCKSQHDDD
jgi:hypothetical protein